MKHPGLVLFGSVTMALAGARLLAQAPPPLAGAEQAAEARDDAPAVRDVDRPRPPRGEGGEARPARPDGEPRPPRGEGPDGRPPRFDAEGRPLRPPVMNQIETMRAYLDVVDRYSQMSHDPAAAGIAAVVTTADMLRAKGPEAAIEYFTKVLPEIKNESVQRCIKLQLVELYKASGKQDRALEQLRQLMVDAPQSINPPPGRGRPGGPDAGRPDRGAGPDGNRPDDGRREGGRPGGDGAQGEGRRGEPGNPPPRRNQ